jgi:hypothetical protein
MLAVFDVNATHLNCSNDAAVSAGMGVASGSIKSGNFVSISAWKSFRTRMRSSSVNGMDIVIPAQMVNTAFDCPQTRKFIDLLSKYCIASRTKQR